MDLRALIFDVHGTLVDIETDERLEQIYRAISHFLVYQGIRLQRWEVMTIYFEIMKEQFAKSGEAFPEFDVVALWKDLLERHGTEYTRSFDPARLHQMPLFLAQLQRGISRKRLVLFPQVLEVLDQLREHYALAVVSDAQSVWAIPELRSVGLHGYFDPVIVSSDFGYRKPDRRLFQTALDRLGVRADQAVYIGNDSYRDIFGASQLDIKTILFRHVKDLVRADETRADYRIGEFSELPRALDYLKAN